MSEKRACKGTTKAGKPCKNAPLKDNDHCIGHLSAKEKEALGFGGPQPGSGRPRMPKPTELARQLLEQHIEVVFAPHFKTLGYDIEIKGGEMKLIASEFGGAKVYGESKDGYIEVSDYDDLGAMIAAAEKLLDRVYGRPKQTTELTGEGGGPIETRELIPTDAKWRDEVTGVIQEAERAAGSALGSDPA